MTVPLIGRIGALVIATTDDRLAAWMRLLDGLRRAPVHDGGLIEAVGSRGLLGGTSP